MVLGRKRGKEKGYLGNKLQGKYHKDTFQTAVNMAWPAIVESFFIAFAGLVDSLMVSSLGSYAVAAVGLTTQPKLLGLAFFFAQNVSLWYFPCNLFPKYPFSFPLFRPNTNFYFTLF